MKILNLKIRHFLSGLNRRIEIAKKTKSVGEYGSTEIHKLKKRKGKQRGYAEPQETFRTISGTLT